MNVINTLLEITIYSAIIFCIIMIIKKLFKLKLSPTFHYVIWVLLFARLLVPVTFQSEFSFFTYTQEINAPANINQSNVVLPKNDFKPELTKNEQETQEKIQQSSLTKESTNAKIKWYYIVIAIWLLGVVLFGIRLIIFNKKIKKIAKERPSTKIIETYKKLNGSIPLYVSRLIPSPVLTAAVKPQIIIPKHLDLTDEQLYFVLKHELTHYKRKDNLIYILINILQCVYWFNPIMWLFSKQIGRDMETACDGDVIKNLPREAKSRYAKTLIALFTECKPTYIAIGINNAEKNAERRIRGIYMKNKSAASALTVTAVLCGILVISCFTTACQPKVNTIVQNKATSKIIKEEVKEHEAEKTEMLPPQEKTELLNSKPDAPKHYFKEESIYKDAAMLKIDSDVQTYSLSEYPAYEIEKQYFSKEQLETLLEEVTEGAQLYVKKYEDENEIDVPISKEEIINSDFSKINESVILEANVEGKGEIQISISENTFFYKMNYGYYAVSGGMSAEEVNIGISKAEAIKMANDIIAKLNMPHMEQVAVTAAVRDSETSKIDDYGYNIVFARRQKDIPAVYTGIPYASFYNIELRELGMVHEVIEIIIANEGVTEIKIYNYSNIVPLKDTATFIPFEEIIESLKINIINDCKQTFDGMIAKKENDEVSEDISIGISNIKLAYLPVKNDANINTPLYMPVWCFQSDYKTNLILIEAGNGRIIND